MGDDYRSPSSDEERIPSVGASSNSSSDDKSPRNSSSSTAQNSHSGESGTTEDDNIYGLDNGISNGTSNNGVTLKRRNVSQRRLTAETSQTADSVVSEPVPENPSYPNFRAYNSGRLKSQESEDFSVATSNAGGIDFLMDPKREMTYGRKLFLKLQHKSWYNPRARLYEAYDDIEGHADTLPNFPSLHKAWAYFEHVVLTRYVVEPHNTNVDKWGVFRKFMHSFSNQDENFERAQPGENQRPTKLYDFITTPHVQLGDFGLGFGLYFSTLRAIGYILFFAGCISAFNIIFFGSNDYSKDGLWRSNPLLYGSAICTDVSWELCVDCNCTEEEQGWERTSRCANTTNTIGDSYTFIKKNRCLENDNIMRKLGVFNYATILFLLFSILGLDSYLRDQAVKFDEDEQTGQDYSILIGNPPPKANDPDVWRRYFEENFPGVKCAAVTCAVNNDLLVRALVARREILRKMELQLDPGTPMDIDHLALLAAKYARSKSGFVKRLIRIFFPRLPDLLSRLVALNTSIKGLAQLGYPCTNVFVTFEKEAHQREVLESLEIGTYHVLKNNVGVLGDRKYLFEGKVLQVSESVEPNSVRWRDLNSTFGERMDQMILTSMLTFASIVAAAQIVIVAEQLHVLGAAFCIAGFNLAFPEFAKLIVHLESHPTESQLQMSLYWKIALFRWVNTAIVITLITPFTHTLEIEQGLIPQICSIFFAEILTVNAIQLTDLWGHFQRHVMAPRASTQDSMNICFQGLEVELAERYTNMTKIMFLAFWYSSIFPGGLFLAAFALCINYYTDRFSLMRTWKRAPHVSTEISTYSRRYFFSAATIILGVMSSFYWAAFPFDNLCEYKEGDMTNDIDLTYNDTVGTYNVTVYHRHSEPTTENVTMEDGGTLFRFCNQDFILRPKEDGIKRFPFIYREGDGEWMDIDQQWLSKIFGWTAVGIMSLTAIKFLFGFIGWVHGSLAGPGTHEELGDDQGIGFHEVRNITGYIPQVRSHTFSYPLIACKVDKIGHQLFDWTDPDRDYTYYDLTKDADHVLSGTNKRARHSFSRVKHYPPNRLDMIKKRKRKIEERIQASKNVFNSVALIDTGNLSATLRKHDKKAKKRDKRGSIFGGSKSNSVDKKGERTSINMEKFDRSGAVPILSSSLNASSHMPSIVENEDSEKE